MENSIYTPAHIVKGKKYKSNMSQLEGTIYMGIRNYPDDTNPKMIILSYDGDDSYDGFIIPNNISHPIWEAGFQPID